MRGRDIAKENGRAEPDWMARWRADALLQERWHLAAEEARQAYTYDQRRSRRLPLPTDEGDIDAVARVMARATSAADLSPAEWHAIGAFHRLGRVRNAALPYLLDLIPSEARQTIGTHDFTELGWEPGEADDVEARLAHEVIRLYRRLRGGAQKRRFLAVFLGLNESGIDAYIRISPDGEPDVGLLADFAALTGTQTG